MLKQILRDEKSVDISSLCSQLDVSNVTVRKYLDKLEREGFLVKVHGGAILAEEYTLQANNELSRFDDSPDKVMSARAAIARSVPELIENGDNIYLGCGVTCSMAAKNLVSKKNITVVTNNIDAAQELSDCGIRTIVLGGDLVQTDGKTYTCGSDTIGQMKRLMVNKAFISADCISLTHGVTVNESRVADIVDAVFGLSATTYLLADHTKFGKTALIFTCSLKNFNGVISDPYLDDSFKSYLFDNDIKLITPYDV